MKLKIYPTIASALMLLGTATLNADDAIKIHLQDGTSDSLRIPLSDIRKITFGEDKFCIVSDDATESYLEYSEVSKITFDVTNDIESIIDNSEKIAIVPNPVVNDFKIFGADICLGKPLTIYSVNGQVVSHTDAWNGEAIDVSHLSQGIYFLNIDKLTIKFIKS